MAKPVHEQPNNLRDQATDWQYAYAPGYPVRLGGFDDNNLTMSKRLALYLQWLSPIQEYMFVDVVNTPIRWRRVDSCCPFKTSNRILDSGLLDIYEIKFGSGTTRTTIC